MADWRVGGHDGQWRSQLYSGFQHPPYYYQVGFHGPRPLRPHGPLPPPPNAWKGKQQQQYFQKKSGTSGSNQGSTNPYAKGADPTKKEETSGGSLGKNAKVNSDLAENFVDVVCYKCGVPGHHKTKCSIPKTCFICRETSHVLEECPVKKQENTCARYIGSAAFGLVFYNIEVPDIEDKMMVNVSNYGKVSIDMRQVTKEELIKELFISFNPISLGKSSSQMNGTTW